MCKCLACGVQAHRVHIFVHWVQAEPVFVDVYGHLGIDSKNRFRMKNWFWRGHGTWASIPNLFPNRFQESIFHPLTRLQIPALDSAWSTLLLKGVKRRKLRLSREGNAKCRHLEKVMQVFQPSIVICILIPVTPFPFSLVQLSPLPSFPGWRSILYVCM